MNRLVVALFVLLVIIGCSTLKYNSDGSFEAQYYAVRTDKITAEPSKFLSIEGLFAEVVKWYSPNIPAIVPFPKPVQPVPPPQPVPAPTPGPYPAPGPTPTPIPPTPTPTPVPVPAPVASTVFTKNGNVLTLDMGNVPSAMSKIGIPGSENALWYALAHVYAYGPGKEMVSELAEQNPHRQKIFDWFDGEVMKVNAMMLANPALTLVTITNDGKDRCGFRLGPAIMDRLRGFGNRVTLGKVMSPDDY